MNDYEAEGRKVKRGSHVRLSNLAVETSHWVQQRGRLGAGENCERGENPNKKNEGDTDREEGIAGRHLEFQTRVTERVS